MAAHVAREALDVGTSARSARSFEAMKHEQSRIYITTRELIWESAVVISKLPPGFGYLADQLPVARAVHALAIRPRPNGSTC